jgi:uncharacterized membrane protein
MRKKIIIITLFFVCSLSLVALLATLQQSFSQSSQEYVRVAIFSSLPSVLISLFGTKLIVDNYQNHQWKVGIGGSVLGVLTGFLYSIITMMVVGQSWVNSQGNSLSVDLSLFFDIVITFLSTLIGGVLGLFASTIGFVSVCLSVVVGSQLAANFSDGVTPIIIATTLSFCLSIFVVSTLIAISGIILPSSKSAKSSIKSTLEDNDLLLGLLDLGRNRKSLLSKGEIMAELKIDIQTVDHLLKQAELGELISVELDHESGILKYRVHI